jgi:hypothetical protein
MSLIDAVAVPVVVTRTGPGARGADGRWVAGATSTFTMPAAVQPAKPDELLDLPEGQRTRGALKIYADAELRTADEETGVGADVITYGGRDYQVRAAEYLAGFGLAAFKAIATRMDLPPEAP